jgi:thiol-disulfide isomerase/thioredoxin
MCMPWRRFFLMAIPGLLIVMAFSAARPRAAFANRVSGYDAQPGDPQLIDLAGYNDVIAKYRGKGILVTFWATWCGPCRAEYPMIAEFARQYASQGLAVVGVSTDANSDMDSVRQFLAKNHPGFPNYRQKPGINADSFYQGVNPEWSGTMPQTDFYARDGHLARYFVGEKPRAVFEDSIRLILASSSGQNELNKSVAPGN